MDQLNTPRDNMSETLFNVVRAVHMRRHLVGDWQPEDFAGFVPRKKHGPDGSQ